MKKQEEKDDIGTFLEVVRAVDESEADPDRHCSVQMDVAVRDAIKAARSSGKKAKVAVTLTLTPGPDRRMGFAVAVKADLPRPPTLPVIRYVDEEGNLFSSNTLPLPFEGATTGRE